MTHHGPSSPLRHPRPTAAYHTAWQQPTGAILAADADYQFFRDALVEAAKKHGLAIHAYVWMTNHVHLLATPEFDHSIGKVFQPA